MAALLDQEGATAIRCSLTGRWEPDPSLIEAGLAALVVGGFDYMIFRTREGVSRTVEAAERAGLKADVLGALGRVVKVVGGPDAAAGFHALDLSPDFRAPSPTTRGLIEAMRPRPLFGRLVGLEVSADGDDLDLFAYLQNAGAHVYRLTCLHFSPPTERHDVAKLVDDVCSGSIDATVFTAATQLERLFQVARQMRLTTGLRNGLAQLHVSAVGPIVLACLRRRRVHVDSVASRPFFTLQIAEALLNCLGPAPESIARGNIA